MGKQVSRKTRIILIACAAGFVAAAAAILLGVLLTQLPKKGDQPPAVQYLPTTGKGELMFAKRSGATRPDGSPLIIARSYDGNPWEAEPDLDNTPADINCDDQGRCTMQVDGDYETYSVDVPQTLKDLTPMHLAARVYLQGGFGASKDELLKFASTYGDNVGLWVQDQMRLTPTLARSYYRSRANARPGTFDVFPVTKPCDINTRWRRYLFDGPDKVQGSLVQISLNTAASRFIIKANNIVRGEVTTFLNYPYPASSSPYTFPLNLRLCVVTEQVNGPITFTLANQTVCNIYWRNPAIDFIPSNYVQSLGPNDAILVNVTGNAGAFILKSRSVSCTGVSDGAGKYYIRQNNVTYMFDSRIKLYRNTPESPSIVDADLAGQCPVVDKTFLNIDQCVRRSTCSAAVSFKSALFTLNDSILRSWYTKSGRYVYYITNLRLEDPYNISPCSSGSSRWQRLGKGACPSPTTTLDATTKATIAAALGASTDTNPYIRDITLTGANCSPTTDTIGAQIDAAGECFQHVHPDLYSVRDFTRWVYIHDGNKDAMAGGNPNPIAKWADSGLTYLQFPASHPMERFYDRRGYIPVVGRYGDQIDFLDVTSDLQTEEVASIVGALRTIPGNEIFVACGSPGETENIPDLGYHYNVWNFNSTTTTGTMADALEWPMPANYDQVAIIENLAIKSADQLRQRVAWTLANTFQISTADTLQAQFLDAWMGYYDIFTRNAFGSYKDILREVSYHPLMGIYLTYMANQAYASSGTYPDENYAREIMQLFSIGLWQLNDDGTQKLDSNGNPIGTYTNDNIMDFARVWTGLDRRGYRTGVASIFQFGGTPNLQDPMYIRPTLHDRFPKAKLDSGYLGDTYPLCDDIPAQAFLREGARYEYTGTFSIEGDVMDGEGNTTSGIRGRFSPPSTSALYQALCAPATDGTCTFPLVVTLTSNLPCTGNQECNAQRVLSVKIVDSVAKIARYYTYVGAPCTRLALFNGQLTERTSTNMQCADPTTRVGYPICCNATTGLIVSKAQSECAFANERTDYATNLQRCTNLGLTTCAAPFKPYTSTTWSNTCAGNVFVWTNTSCSVQIQVYSAGQVGLIDPSTSSFNIFKPSSNNAFRVYWNGGAYPTADGVNCPQGCAFQATPDGAGSCLCNVTISSVPIFNQLSDLNAINADGAVDAIAQQAFIGSVKPSIYDDGTYTACTSSECTRLNNVVVWLHKDDNGGLSTRTIFQLPSFRVGGRVRYLMNRESTVTVGGSFSFRNPPTFLPLLGQQNEGAETWLSENLWVTRVANEIDSLLEHLFEHDNTAVFVSYHFIQHMITSNPSPRFMKTVVNAFRTGAVGNVQFSGKYGDLAAMVYAILVDQEARSPIVEVDRTYGMLKDPLVKTYHFMRSLEYTATNGREIAFWTTDQVFGVQPFTTPTVFGFYLPEYRPDGVIGNAGIVSPQAQLATTPNLVGFFNGITSLVDNGLTSCDGGLGLPMNPTTRTCVTTGPHSSSDGTLAYTPPDGASTEDIVDELNMILLAGRLAPQTRDLFISEYNNMLTNATMAPQALRHLLKLFAISSEYQATNYNALTTEERTFSKVVPPQGRRFKAIVVINLTGGCDSFSLLVPLANCTKDMYKEYVQVRTTAALDPSYLLPINVPAGTQVCNTFGVHKAMPNLRGLYNAGDALFVSNIGAMVAPIANKTAVIRNTARLPPSLYAHNIMQRNVQNVYAQLISANGVLGRITDAMLEASPPFPVSQFSLGGNVKMVQGSTPANYISPVSGFVRVRGLNKIGNALANITKYTSESVFSDTYADGMHYAVGKTEVLAAILANTTVNTTFGRTSMDFQMMQVAKLIKVLPDNGVERGVFYTTTGGFDTHATFDLNPMLSPIDTALGSFVTEMKAQGRWDDVVIVTVSDFGRTLTSNGQGTDHAWAGNHWVAGGSIKGGQILGKYPEVLLPEGDLILDRGRVIPTTPFEGVWQGVAEWYGVPADQMDTVLPNLKNFGNDVRYDQSEMFKK